MLARLERFLVVVFFGLVSVVGVCMVSVTFCFKVSVTICHGFRYVVYGFRRWIFGGFCRRRRIRNFRTYRAIPRLFGF